MVDGSRLRNARDRAKLTQGQVAAFENTSQGYISDIELNRRQPASWDFIVRLAQRYHTSADYLLGLTDNPSPRVVDAKTDEERALLDIAKRLTPLRQGELLRLARAVEESQEDTGHLVLRELDTLDKRAAASTPEIRRAELYGLLRMVEHLVQSINGEDVGILLRSVVDTSGEQSAE